LFVTAARSIGLVDRSGWCESTCGALYCTCPRDVEIAVAEYVDWFNHRRVHGEIRLVPPAEFEASYWASITTEHSPVTPVPAGAGSK
jgi:hypothetical protein